MKVGESSIAASRPASRSDLLRRGRGGASVGGGVVMVVVTTISLAFQAVPLAGHVGCPPMCPGQRGTPTCACPGHGPALLLGELLELALQVGERGVAGFLAGQRRV